ncbi:MAG: hypothetical protein IJK21_02535 [Prevotella sp.]|nr:hypothetical protein [Prevotella sp.]
MRRILFIIIALALKSCLYAQDDYRPFVEEGKTWNYIIYTNGQESFPARLVIKGDTIVDGTEYKKVIHESEEYWLDWDEEETKDLFAVVREEGKKIYLRYFYKYGSPPSREILIYDFGLKIGDIFFEDFYGYVDEWSTKLKLESIDEKDGMRIFVFSINNNSTRQWVEGVGGRYGLGLEEVFSQPTCIDCIHYFPTLVSCSLGDEVLCRFDDDGNVVLGVEEVRTDVNKDKSVYDLQGRRLSAEPSHGIYIKDGKKVAR